MSVKSEPTHRVALIGYGVGGAIFHAPLVSAIKSLHLAAIVTRSPEKASRAKRDYPNAEILGSADEVFANPKMYDLVIVCSPNRHHFSQAKAALEAGMNVVIDKPMAVHSKDCLELLQLAKRQKRLLTVFQNRRWDGDFLTVKKLVDEQTLGQIFRFESRFERYRPTPRIGAWRELGSKEDGGGLLFDLGSHLIDQACFLFGTPDTVYCELDKRRFGVETDDDCFVALSFPSGVKAHLWASVMVRMNGPRFRVIGHKGCFEKKALDPQEDSLRAGLRPTDASWGVDNERNWGSVLTDVGTLPMDGKIKTETGSYQKFYENVSECLSDPENTKLSVEPIEAYRTMQIIEAASQSAASHKVISLDN